MNFTILPTKEIDFYKVFDLCKNWDWGWNVKDTVFKKDNMCLIDEVIVHNKPFLNRIYSIRIFVINALIHRLDILPRMR